MFYHEKKVFEYLFSPIFLNSYKSSFPLLLFHPPPWKTYKNMFPKYTESTKLVLACGPCQQVLVGGGMPQVVFHVAQFSTFL